MTNFQFYSIFVQFFENIVRTVSFSFCIPRSDMQSNTTADLIKSIETKSLVELILGNLLRKIELQIELRTIFG